MRPSTGRRKPNLANEAGDTHGGHYMQPMLDPDLAEQVLTTLRSARASEDHCMRILGFLAWPDGTVKPGSDTARKEARKELQRIANKYRVA